MPQIATISLRTRRLTLWATFDHMQCGKQGPKWLDRGSCRGGFQTRPGATDADHEVSQGSVAMHEGRVSIALTSRTILRGGRMTPRTSRKRFLPKQGGFKTRPYKSPDLCAASRKRGLWVSADFRLGSLATIL